MCEQSCVPRIGWSCSNAALTIERPSVAFNSRKFPSGSSAGAAVCAPAPGTRAQQAPIRHTASDSPCILLKSNLPLVCRIAQRPWLLRVEVAFYLGSLLGRGGEINFPRNVIGRWASLWGIGNPLGSMAGFERRAADSGTLPSSLLLGLWCCG